MKDDVVVLSVISITRTSPPFVMLNNAVHVLIQFNLMVMMNALILRG